MYTKEGKKLRHYHHIRLDKEFKNDCEMWLKFLSKQDVVNRPFIDLNKNLISQEINFYSDASAAESLGFGVIFKTRWSFGQWEEGFIKKYSPSIQFLELYALCAGIFIFQHDLKQIRITVHCDNKSVVDMINGTVSSCKYCMCLLRRLTLNNMLHDRRVFAEHVEGSKNDLADDLSRLKFKDFFKDAPKNVHPYPEKLRVEVWTLSKLWCEFRDELGLDNN